MIYVQKYPSKEYRDDFLKSPTWEYQRSTVLSLFPVCQVCGRNKSTQVHHLVYGNFTTGQKLYAICEWCHKRVTIALMNGRIKIRRGSKESIPQQIYRSIENSIGPRYDLLTQDILLQLQSLIGIGRNLACGILKILPREDFSCLKEKKIRHKQMNKIKWIIKTFPHRIIN